MSGNRALAYNTSDLDTCLNDLLSMANSYRYSHHARRALFHAEALATAYAHLHQDTAHLLVGVLLTDGSIGAAVMKGFDLDKERAKVYLKRLLPNQETSTEIFPDESFEQALAFADDEASWLGTHYIGTEHLLLGITRANLGNAVRFLKLVDITPEQLRRRVRLALQTGQTEFSLHRVRQNARLSEIGKRVLYAAEQMAIALDHPSVGLGHLLMALVKERRSVCPQILRQSGLDELRLTQGLHHQNDDTLVNVEVVLQGAVAQASRLGNHYVGADHLLFALTLIQDGTTLLQAYGAEPDRVNRLVSKHFRSD